MNLYYGGCGNYQEFVVAENLEDAKKKIGAKLNAPYLPIEAKVLDSIDGYTVLAVENGKTPEEKTDSEEIKLGNLSADAPEKHCKQCDFTCVNQGELLAHYRKSHPKGE